MYLMIYIFNSIFKTHESMYKLFASYAATPRKEKLLSVQQHPVPENSLFFKSGAIFKCGQTAQKCSYSGDVVTHLRVQAKQAIFHCTFQLSCSTLFYMMYL